MRVSRARRYRIAKTNQSPEPGAPVRDDFAPSLGVFFSNGVDPEYTVLADFHARHAAESPAMLQRLQQAVIVNQKVFEVLMEAVRCCSLGQITNALFEVGGQYRRSM